MENKSDFVIVSVILLIAIASVISLQINTRSDSLYSIDAVGMGTGVMPGSTVVDCIVNGKPMAYGVTATWYNPGTILGADDDSSAEALQNAFNKFDMYFREKINEARYKVKNNAEDYCAGLFVDPSIYRRGISGTSDTKATYVIKPIQCYATEERDLTLSNFQVVGVDSKGRPLTDPPISSSFTAKYIEGGTTKVFLRLMSGLLYTAGASKYPQPGIVGIKSVAILCKAIIPP